MRFEELERKYRNMTAQEIIAKLEDQYKDDIDALEAIERAKTNIAYIERQPPNYKGQTAKQCALTLACDLIVWG